MRKNFLKTILLILVIVFVLSGIVVNAEQGLKLQLHFAPQIMNDITGEIFVDVCANNVDASLPKTYGDICAITFSFEYDDDNFNIEKDDSGNVKFYTDDKTLIKTPSYIESKLTKNRVMVTFIDSSFGDNLIGRDGVLCRFKLLSKNVRALWNSFDKYPIRFYPGSVGIGTYRTSTAEIVRFYNFEAIDGMVGGYNEFPDLTVPSIDKYITFTLDNPTIMVNEEASVMDALPFAQNDVVMIPMRFFAEGIGMSVEWNGEEAIASSYIQNKTLAVSLKNNALYVNSAKCDTDVSPIEINGRTFIPVTAVEHLFGDAELTQNGSEVTIYIP